MRKVLVREKSDLGSQNICLVPDWRVWRWSAIRKWQSPETDGSPFTRYLPVFYLPLLGRSFNDLFYALALRKVVKEVRHGDIVYVPWLYPDGVAAVNVFRGKGVRLWLMALGSDTFHVQSGRRRRKVVDACEMAEGIVCVAVSVANRLADAGVAHSKLHVVPNGVDTSLFHPRDKHKSWEHLAKRQFANGKLRPTGPMVLFVGNLVPVKGVDVLLNAFARMPKNAHLIIIGIGPMQRILEQLAENLGIADRVFLLGRRPPEEVALWMNVADCLCLTSLSEGMPNVVLEARASGLPVVATPAGACSELALDKGGLHVVADVSAEAVAAGLKQMLSFRVASEADPVVPTWERQASRVLELLGVRQ